MLGAAALIYAVMLPKRQENKHLSSEQLVKEVEATLEQYMADIEEENDTLVDLVGQIKKDTTSKQVAMEEHMREMHQRLLQVEHQAEQQAALIMEADQERRLHVSELAELNRVKAAVIDTSEVKQSIKMAVPENSIKYRYAELFELYEQGKSIDLIGKSVGLQRGEVQLILQLAKQEESL